MMAGISFAAPSTSATDAASPPQHASDKGTAFSATFSDAAHDATQVDQAKSRQSAQKDKDKDDKDDRRDVPPAVAASTHHAAARTRDDITAKDRESDAKDKGTCAVARSSARSAARPDDGEASEVEGSETPVDTAELAPVLDALKQASSITNAVEQQQAATDATQSVATAQANAAADPLPATASLLAARIVPANAQQADAKTPATSKKNERTDAAGTLSAIGSTVAGAVAGSDPQAQAAPDSATAAQPGAGQQLAAGGADRALDMMKQGAWLDGLARDIAATGDSASTLRFQAAPTHLGAVQVEIARGLEGAAVTLTASSESSRIALADAKPQLIAEARAQGIHIASAQVDVSTDPRQSNTGGQTDPRHDPRGDTSLSSQGGGDGRSNGQSQTRSQPFAINQTAESQSAAPVEADSSAADAAPAGGMYA
ncbi:flagellar hook-length control protein FliK [Sphingomonas oryzagri]